MILEFSIENFKSFSNRQSFSMLADTSKSEYPKNIFKVGEKSSVLPAVVLYGANASGKSNLMKAFQEFRKIILTSGNNTPKNAFSAYIPFKFNPDLANQRVQFELYFMVQQIRYVYSFAILRDTVVTEKLLFYPQGREAKLFIREGQQFEFGDYLKGQKSVVADITTPNQLFLSKGAQNNLEPLTSLYLYFENDMMPVPFLDKWIDSRYLDLLAETIVKDEDAIFIHHFKNLLKSFDTGIIDFKVEKLKEPMPFSSDFEVYAQHYLHNSAGEQIGKTWLPLEEESEGTQKLFVLGGLILRAILKGRTIIIDEFERSLHPYISQYIIQLFNNPKVNTQQAQLIIATHDTNLLTKDTHLRRDQIWIVEKDNQGISELIALSDFADLRPSSPFEKWYLSGKFGGVPGIESLNFELNLPNEAA